MGSEIKITTTTRKLLGLNFYKANFYEAKSITIYPGFLPCEDVGLHILFENPHFEYGALDFFDSVNWFEACYSTLLLVALHLIDISVLNLKVYEVDEFYAFDLIKTKRTKYYFKVADHYDGEDLICQEFYKAVNKSRDKNSMPDLMEVFIQFLNIFFKTNALFSDPSRTFMIHALKEYAKRYDWMRIDENKRFMGLWKDSKVEITKIYIPRLTMQHKDLSDLNRNLRKSNKAYLAYTKEFKSQLKKAFEKFKSNKSQGVFIGPFRIVKY
ncbi:hypothetical protein Q2T40_11200 [Winogradskyella maritima]|uniref:Uncharacterized protein n=1 Tax=Winogradskyella maritima TaxID=1517766 RepID=A0ABV8AKW8_9FLAO|nr:hypothetical protein [Winogradskyella maritima]